MNVTGGNKRPLVVLNNCQKHGKTEKYYKTSDSDSTISVQPYDKLLNYSPDKVIVLDYSQGSTKNQIDLEIDTNPSINCHGESFSYEKMTGQSLKDAQTETDADSRTDYDEKSLNTFKKKKRRFLTICTSNCKYDVVRRVAARFGMKEVTEDSSWNLYWTDLSISIERAKDMKRFQKVNHFPGMTEICRKDLLARNLNRMLKLFPKEYNFFPKTWCLPADHGEALAYAKIRRAKTFIVKPDTGCQGRGIYLTKNLKNIKLYERMICQVYVSRPFLIDGLKFDLRVYALITSCDPLRVYVYNDGLARFATSRYKEPTGHNTSNVFMHLTNYAVNKHSRTFVIDDEAGSKRKISTLNKWLKMKGIDVDEVWSKIDEIVVKTILAAYPVLKHSYHACFPTHDMTYACFELLGFDILLDWKLKPYLLEVNHSPSFHTDAQIDKDIKESLLRDTFVMLNFHECDKRKIIEEDRKRVRERLLQGINPKDSNFIDSAAGFAKCEKTDEDPLRKQWKWEDEHLGNFRRVYPGLGGEKYDAFFKQASSSMFQETTASRAREEAVKIQKEEAEMRIKEQESKKIFGKWCEAKVRPESPVNHKKSSTTINSAKWKSVTIAKKMTPCGGNKNSSVTPTPSNVLYSFEPEIICDAEERERVTALAHRDFLIKSYGILEQIYSSMKKNGILRKEDEKKYGTYGKLGYVRDISLNVNCVGHKPSCSQQNMSLSTQWKLQPIANQSAEYMLKNRLTENGKTGQNEDKRLNIFCNEAPIYARSGTNEKYWQNDSNTKERVTRTHVVRTLSNVLRLHALEKRESPNSVKSKIK